MVKKQRSENQQGCDGEAEGIGHQERPEGRIFREGCVYPGNSYAADPKDGQDRGDEGDTKASQITGHDLIKHAENVGGAGCGNDHRSQTVDGGLDDDVGNIKDCTLYTSRKTDLKNRQEAVFVDLKFSEIQADPFFCPHQFYEKNQGADGVGKNGGDGHAVYSHVRRRVSPEDLDKSGQDGGMYGI